MHPPRRRVPSTATLGCLFPTSRPARHRVMPESRLTPSVRQSAAGDGGQPITTAAYDHHLLKSGGILKPVILNSAVAAGTWSIGRGASRQPGSTGRCQQQRWPARPQPSSASSRHTGGSRADADSLRIRAKRGPPTRVRHASAATDAGLPARADRPRCWCSTPIRVTPAVTAFTRFRKPRPHTLRRVAGFGCL